MSHFAKNSESKAEIENTSLHHHLINNHDIPAKKGEIKGKLPLEQVFGFCRIFKEITKQLGFHLIFKTAGEQDII